MLYIWSRQSSSDIRPFQKASQICLSIFRQISFSYVYEVISSRRGMRWSVSRWWLQDHMQLSGPSFWYRLLINGLLQGGLLLAEATQTAPLHQFLAVEHPEPVHWPVQKDPGWCQLIAITINWLVQTLKDMLQVLLNEPCVSISCGRSSNSWLSNPACSTVMRPQWQKYRALSSHSVRRLNIQVVGFSSAPAAFYCPFFPGIPI